MNMALVRKDFTEEPWALPEGWCWVAISDVIQKIQTLDPRRDRTATAFDYIDLSALSDGAVVGAKRMLGKNAPSRARQVVEPNDTLLSCVRVYLENAGLVGDALVSPVASTAFCVLRSNGAVDPRYLNYFVRSRRFVQWLIPLQRGNSPPAVVDTDVKSRPLPLPPLAEQRRIVARIDALFEEIVEGEQALDAARKGLETYRRALLKAAVTGELTAEWREGLPTSSTGNDVLSKVRGTPKNASLRRRKRTEGAATRDHDIGTLPRIPANWAWGRLSELGDFGRGKSRHRPRDDKRLYGGEMPFVQTGIIANSTDYITRFAQTYSPFGVSQSRVWPAGTLCITIAANIAKTAITTFPCCFPDSVVGLTPKAPIGPYWVHLWVQTIQQKLERYAPATAQKNINLEVLNAVSVPIPPSDECDEILRRVANGLSAVSDTQRVLDAETSDVQRLRQSVLKAAFEGRLVPQDDRDEPAAALIARLAVNPPAPRARRGRPKANLLKDFQ